MSKNKSNIQAVLDTDLEKLLAQTNQLHDFIEGKISCPKCGAIITEDNVGILYPYEIEGDIITGGQAQCDVLPVPIKLLSS